MLKFFRKYNKWILAVGGGLLMIVFLIQPVMQMFQKDPNTVVIGTFDGGEVTRGDIMAADGQIRIVRQFGLYLDGGRGNESEDNIRWALILKDAERLGLSASLAEVEQIKLNAGRSAADVEMMASQMNATTGYINMAIRNWLIIQRYKELTAGQAHLAGVQRAALAQQSFANKDAAVLLQAMAYGNSRMSKPLIEHFIQDQGAKVMGKAVLIDAESLMDQTPKPSEEDVKTLFDEYKDALPGQGEPYGFGYRVPNRVKVEYLVIASDEAKQHVKINEADALAYHRKHPELYSAAGSQNQLKPYEQVRDQVIEDLTTEKAYALVEKMTKTAFGLLYEDTRGMDKVDDYRVIGDITKLRSMREVADKLEDEYGFRPEVVKGNSGGWVTEQELWMLPGIGQTVLADNYNVTFAEYVLSARELKPGPDNRLLPRRLQVGLAAAPMMDISRTQYIFRLTDAEPTRVPDSLDEVRTQVMQDAWRLAAYKKLLSASDTWLQEAVDGGLEAVANTADSTVLELPATSRRIQVTNGKLVIPPLPGIGQSAKFIDAFFATANSVKATGDLSNAPAEDVTGVVGVDKELALAVYRVEDYEPITQQAYQALSADIRLPVLIEMSMLSSVSVPSPISYDALVERLNYDNGSTDQQQEAEAAAGAAASPADEQNGAAETETGESTDGAS